MRDVIIEVSTINEWPGPLCKEVVRVMPNIKITKELAPWCNEIHSDNYNCPPEIREALIRREEQLKILFKNKTTSTGFKEKKERKQRGKKSKK